MKIENKDNQRLYIVYIALFVIIVLTIILILSNLPIKSFNKSADATPVMILNGAKIDINHATITQLKQVNGIGESLANRIIEYRNKVGRITKLDDLRNIKGIGDTILQQIDKKFYFDN
jgi:competence ComEA-like helix-hairpin-helix protein